MSTHNICFCAEIRKIFIWIYPLSESIILNKVCLHLKFARHQAKMSRCLTLKVLSKICSRQHLFLFFFIFSKKTSLDIPCESSAKQTIHMKYQDLFSLKN